MASGIDGTEAFAMFKEHEYDTVVSDVDMPWMSGVVLCEKIHSDSCLAKIPVVLVTSPDITRGPYSWVHRQGRRVCDHE